MIDAIVAGDAFSIGRAVSLEALPDLLRPAGPLGAL